MSDSPLRASLIRLAHSNPELRAYLLPVLNETESAGTGAGGGPKVAGRTEKSVRDSWAEVRNALGDAEASLEDIRFHLNRARENAAAANAHISDDDSEELEKLIARAINGSDLSALTAVVTRLSSSAQEILRGWDDELRG